MNPTPTPSVAPTSTGIPRVDAINQQISTTGGIAPSAQQFNNPKDSPNYNPAIDPTSSAYAGSGLSVSTPNTNVIGANNLGQTNPITLPTTQAQTNPATPIISGAQKAQAQAEAQAKATVEAEQAGVKGAQSQTSGILATIQGLFSQEANAQQARATGADQATIDAQNKDLANINTQIADTNVKLRGELDAIAGRGDISASAQAQLKDVANANYGRTLADLAIRQSAANNNVTALTKAADEKLNLILAPIQTQIQYYKDFALANAENLTKSEQTKVDQIITEKNNIIKSETDKQKSLTDTLTEFSKAGVKLPDTLVQQMINNPTNAMALATSAGYVAYKPDANAINSAEVNNINSQLTAISSKSSDGYTDPNLYQRLRATAKMSATDFDNRFGSLVNPASRARLGIGASSSGTFGTPTQADVSGVMSALAKDTKASATVDKGRLQSDPTYFYWVKSQLGI